MNEIKPAGAAMLRQVKEEAKKAVRAGRGQHMRLLESLARSKGVSTYHELKKVASNVQSDKFIDLAEVLDCPLRSSIVHRVRIGDSVWSLRAEDSGPRLYLEHRPGATVMDRSVISEVGLFQVLQLEKNLYDSNPQERGTAWVVARYGQHRCHTLDFMSNQEVVTLSWHFGIPFYTEIGRMPQQQCSELAFYRSPSFRRLRAAFRSGLQPLPSLSKWCYGLSPIWAHLVAGQDSILEQVDEIFERYAHASYRELAKANRRLSELWPQVPTLGAPGERFEYGFESMLYSSRR